jgi:SAM-dependent methyltransferase
VIRRVRAGEDTASDRRAIASQTATALQEPKVRERLAWLGVDRLEFDDLVRKDRPREPTRSVGLTFAAADGDGYELQMGRWSRRLAPLFIEFAGIGQARRVLDVGCGTGNLALFHAQRDSRWSRSMASMCARPMSSTQGAAATTLG